MPPAIHFYSHSSSDTCFRKVDNFSRMPTMNHLIKLALTHWGWVMHICVSKLTIIGSDNGLSPKRRQAIIWTKAAILSIWPLATNSSENWIGIQRFSFKKMHFKMSFSKWRPFCLGLNELTTSLEHMDDTGFGENYSASYAPREYFIHGVLNSKSSNRWYYHRQFGDQCVSMPRATEPKTLTHGV